MLYDKRWDRPAEVKTDPLTLEALIAWLERQPKEGDYSYTNAEKCVMGQYMRFHGLPSRCGFDHPDFLAHYFGAPYPGVFYKIAIRHPRTFGAALERARACQK